MLRIAVCDDEREETCHILGLVGRYRELHPELDIRARGFDSARELYHALENGRVYQIFLLDILMPGTDGIMLAKYLRKKDEHGVLIFITDSRDHALEAYEVRALRYLLKPVKEDSVFSALDDAARMLNGDLSKSWLVPVLEGFCKIRLSTISFVECSNRILYVHLTGGTVMQSRNVRGSFEQAVGPLLEDFGFVRTHQSFLVNLFYAAKLTRTEFHMEDGSIVPVSKKRYSVVKKRYIGFIETME